ncbi:MAG TPA: fumarylacetoacetate hydrolase family protein [Xanthobacteraceae bacterium]|nr:fumarylacetoacetate hydrolase family protein [Xanthobacteraceae bacterium]
MKLASYMVDGKAKFGVVSGDGIIDGTRCLGGRFSTLRQALAADALDEVRRATAGQTPDHKLSDVKFLPVVPDPRRIVCVGINYRSHAEETGREISPAPSVFLRLADTLVGHGGALVRPKVSDKFDFEGELAIIIARPGRHIVETDALKYVAGYTCFVDGSVRDYQKFSVTSGKNFPGTGPLGPILVTTDEIPDPTRLTLVTRLNGIEMQRSGTDMLIYSIPQVIKFISDFTGLAAGDIIATGTPAGVGHRRTPPVWMKAGDVLEVEISGIGTLRNPVVDE